MAKDLTKGEQPAPARLGGRIPLGRADSVPALGGALAEAAGPMGLVLLCPGRSRGDAGRAFLLSERQVSREQGLICGRWTRSLAYLDAKWGMNKPRSNGWLGRQERHAPWERSGSSPAQMGMGQDPVGSGQGDRGGRRQPPSADSAGHDRQKGTDRISCERGTTRENALIAEKPVIRNRTSTIPRDSLPRWSSHHPLKRPGTRFKPRPDTLRPLPRCCRFSRLVS